MPIGLVDEPSRSADQAARAFVRSASSSIFNAPGRSVLAITTHAQAIALSQAAIGKALSAQSFALLVKIREVDVHGDLGEANVVGIDDVVDAAAAAWSARRIALGAARTFPASPSQRTASGRTIAIWA